MNRRRRAYRPEVVGTLEDRLVLSAVATVSLGTFEHGSQTHPVADVTFAGSDQAKVLTQGGKPLHGQLTFSGQEIALTRSGAGQVATATYKVDYHNESSKAITSATLVDTLAHGLAYDPGGSSHVAPGGQLTESTGPDGSQVVELDLPGGIAPGAEGYLEFQASGILPSPGK